MALVRFNAMRRRYWAIRNDESAHIFDAHRFLPIMRNHADKGDFQARAIVQHLADEAANLTIAPSRIIKGREYAFHMPDVLPGCLAASNAARFEGMVP
ncbi:hypothetical protein [Kozakia baliensis]|uniref:hypothetical protein n=1 Tax=Kozakia baliensis TaxID=153496 RepID=UPI001244A827|nr:hypothetical protein [Kozakia baliensis]